MAKKRRARSRKGGSSRATLKRASSNTTILGELLNYDEESFVRQASNLKDEIKK